MAEQPISVKLKRDDIVSPEMDILYSKYDVYCTLENEVVSPIDGSLKKYVKVNLNETFFDLGYIDIVNPIIVQVWIEVYINKIGWVVSESKFTQPITYNTYNTGGRKNDSIRIKIMERRNGFGTLNRIVQPGWPSTPELESKKSKKK